MKSIRLKSYGKINLTLDVLRRYEDGFHELEMIMQAVKLSDDMLFRWWEDDSDEFLIQINSNKYYLPVDERNIAYKAASFMHKRFCSDKNHKKNGKLRIDLKKRIPVSAGMAGGSSNCAATILALNYLWDLKLSLEELLEVARNLGSDVSFLVMANIRGNEGLFSYMGADVQKCGTCVFAKGKGTELEVIEPLNSNILISKPPISVSTKEVYQGLDLSKINDKPSNKNVIQALESGILDIDFARENMSNVLESYTLNKYKVVDKTKKSMQMLCKNSFVMMSGSGPTVFGIVPSKHELKRAYYKLKKVNKETYITRTMI